LLGLLAFTCLAFAPLAGRFSTHMVCHGVRPGRDLVLHIWQYWWAQRALSGEEALFSTELLTWPAQLDLTELWGGHLDLVIGSPLVGAFGPLAASNAAVFVLYLSCGVGVYLLAHALSRDRLAAVLAAVLYQLSPALLNEVQQGRVEELCFGLVALFLLFLGRWYREGLRRDLVLAAAFMGLAAFDYLGAVLITGLGLPLLGLGFFLAAPAERGGDPPARRELLRRTGWLVLVASAGVLPVALYVWLTLGPSTLLPPLFHRGPDQPLGEWIMVSSGASASMDWSRLFGLRPMGRPNGAALVLPLAALVAALGGWRAGRRLWPWAFCGLVLHLMALGPWLVSLQDGLRLPSPYQALGWLVPGFIRFHWPYRFLLLGGVCLAVMVALGLAQLRSALRGRWSGLGCVAVSGLLLGLALLQVNKRFPMPVCEPPPLPESYQALSELEAGAIFDLIPPSGPCVYAPILAQIQHGLPSCCLDTPRALWSSELRRLYETNGAYASLSRLSRGYWTQTANHLPLRHELAQLRKLGFTHVVLQQCRVRSNRAEGPEGPRKRVRPGMKNGDNYSSRESNCHIKMPQKSILRRRLGEPVFQECLPDGAMMIFELPRGGVD